LTPAVVIGALLACGIAVALAWKWQLGVRRTSIAIVLVAAAGAAIVTLLDGAVGLHALLAAALVFGFTVVVAAASVAYRFYRDPERVVPQDEGAIVSPADGEVLYVRESRGGALPVVSKLGRDYTLEELTRTPLASEDAVVIGIGLSFLDVHVNRAPVGGRIALQRRFPGRFGSLRRPEMVFENERATLVIERDGLEVAVVMIASRLVRRIVTYLSEGDRVAAGQRIGMIRFGSQVDLVLPVREDLRVDVRSGDRVVAGESIVARVESLSARAAAAGRDPTASVRAPS
jgi:phosphatidylserine decarboxylase